MSTSAQLKTQTGETCQEVKYLIDLNGAQAAIRAGYSAKTAPEIASENLIKPNIAAAMLDEREVQKSLRRVLLKYKLHKDQALFDQAYAYIKEYY